MGAEAFHSSFSNCYNNSNLFDANMVLMNELGCLLATKRSDFVFLLNESGVPASEQMSDFDLIELFIENVGKNKKLALGASLFINMNNKQIGFDGEEKVNDSVVKAGYYTLTDQFSNAGGALLGAVQGLAGLGKGIVDAQQNKKFGVTNALKQKQQAKAALQQQVLKQRQAQIQAESKKKADEAKRKRIIIISAVSITSLLIVGGIIIYIKKRKG